jgi:uncharacterized protein with HEPN domain
MLPDDTDAAHVWDMCEAAREALSFVHGLTYEDFLADARARRAVERDLEILGEAARRVSSPLQNAHPEIPWRDIIGQRNILAHDYGNVMPGLVWESATHDLADLISKLERLMPPSEGT